MLGDSTHYDPATYINDPEENRDDKHLIGDRAQAGPIPSISVSPDLQQARSTFMSANKGFMANEKSASDQPTYGRPIYIARLCLRILSLVLSLGVVGLVASVMARHAETKDLVVVNPRTGLEYRVWPLNTNYVPSNLLLGAASIASIGSLGLVIASFTKSVSGPLYLEKRREMRKKGRGTNLTQHRYVDSQRSELLQRYVSPSRRLCFGSRPQHTTSFGIRRRGHTSTCGRGPVRTRVISSRMVSIWPRCAWKW